MGIEIGILNWIQNLHTPAADAVMCFVTRLGDGGILWILLIVLLFLIPKTRKSGIILAAALCVDLVLCNGVLKHLFYRIRPCDVNTAVQLLIPKTGGFLFSVGTYGGGFFCGGSGALFVRREKIMEIRTCAGGVYRFFQAVSVRSLSYGYSGRHCRRTVIRIYGLPDGEKSI